MSVSLDAEGVKTGPTRARCGPCGNRFAWPEGEPSPLFEPMIATVVACPACHRVVALEEEPVDESWWAYVTGEPLTRPAQPPQRPTPARTAHRSQGRSVRGGVKV